MQQRWIQVHTPLVSTTKERPPPAKRTPPTTIKECAMHTRHPQGGGVLAPHAQANVLGRHMVDHHDAGWRGGSVGPHAQGNTVRRVEDYLSADRSGQQKL